MAAVSRFDWYRATVPANPQLLIEACSVLAGPDAQIEEGKGRFNYERSTTIRRAGDRVATVLHGGSNGHPNVEASGEQSPALAAMLRQAGAHRVTRCDVARDHCGEQTFQQLQGLAERLADTHGLAYRHIANHPKRASEGQTVYLGSRQSVVFARIYEKGKAERENYSDIDPAVLDAWVRIELEVKPQKDMKALAATMEPAAFWGISAWTMQLAQEAFAMAPEPIPFHPRRMASDDRAFGFMCAQYRNLLRRRCDTLHSGDKLALAQEIVAAVFEQQDDAAA